MKLLIWVVLLLFPLLTLSQSIDEEEPVHFQVEGSGNVISDDEDIAQEEASGLPPENTYASSPVLHPKMTTVPQHHAETTHGVTEDNRPTTTIVKQYKVSTYATTTPRISTRPPSDSASSGSFLSSPIALVTLLVVLSILVIIIIVIICCCRNKKKRYEPTKRDDY